MKVRIRFAKENKAKYIAHLSVSKIFSRALNRLSIPVKYTQGFHMHPHLVFSAPLSLGYESLCEILDFELTQDMPYDEIVTKFSGALPIGFAVCDAYEPESKLSAIAYALYEICYELKDAKYKKEIAQLFEQDEVYIEKKSKSSRQKVNLIPSIYSISFEDTTETGLLVKTILPCSSSENMNPKYITDAVDINFPGAVLAVSYKKTEIYDQERKKYR